MVTIAEYCVRGLFDLMIGNNRGLNNFLTEIYSGSTKEEIETRIYVELAKIKKAFFSPKLSSKNRKKYVTKLCFIVLSGKQVSFGLPQIIELIESKKISMQRVGWMAAVILSGSDADQINELIPTIDKTLENTKNEIGVNFALCAISSIGGSKLAESFGPTIVDFALSTKYQDYTQKKALLALVSLYRSTQLPIIDTIAAQLTPLLMDASYGIRISASHLIHTIQAFHPSSVSGVYNQVLEILKSIFLDNEYDHEFSMTEIPCSILSGRLLQILSFKTDWSIEEIEAFESIVLNIISRFPQIKDGNLLISFFTVFAEVVSLSLTTSISNDTIQQIFDILANNINSSVLPVNYFCIDSLATYIQMFTQFQSLPEPSFSPLFDMMRSRRPEMDRRSLLLLYISSNKINGLTILSEFLDYLPSCPLYLRDTLLEKSAKLTFCFSIDNKWCIDTLIRIINDLSCDVSNTNVFELIYIYVSGKEKLHIYLIQKVYNILVNSKKSVSDSFIKLATYLFGEFTYLLKDDIKLNSLIDLMSQLYLKSNGVNDSSKSMIITFLFKIAVKYPQFKTQIIRFLDTQRSSFILEVSQRCCEYYQMLLTLPDSLLQRMVDNNNKESLLAKTSAIIYPKEQNDEKTRKYIGFKNHSTEVIACEDEIDKPNDLFELNTKFLQTNQGEIFSNRLCSVFVSLILFAPSAKVSVFIRNNIIVTTPPASNYNMPYNSTSNISISSEASGSASASQSHSQSSNIFQNIANLTSFKKSLSNYALSTNSTNVVDGVSFGSAVEEYDEEEDYEEDEYQSTMKNNEDAILTIKHLKVTTENSLKFRILDFSENDEFPIEPGSQKEIVIEFVAVDIFDTMPKLTFEANRETISISIPIMFQRWIRKMEMDQATFLSRWNQINDRRNIATITLVIPDGDVMLFVKNIAKTIFGLDPLNFELNSNNAVMCGVFICSSKSIGILLRFIYNQSENDLSLTMKSTSPDATDLLKGRLYKYL